MDSTLNEVLVHLNENVDPSTLSEIEQSIRQDQGVISVGRRPNQNHLLLVIYDSAVMHASGVLRTFKERGLHAQVIGM